MAIESSLAATWDPSRWRDKAACRDLAPDLFFPIGETGPAVAHAAQAKAVCCSCPVVEHCLEFAVRTNQEYGIWGGTDEEERRQLRRRWRAGRRSQAS